MIARFVGALLALALLVVPALAWAAPQLQTIVSASTVEVGEEVEVSIQAMTEGDMPKNPQVSAGGLSASAPSISPSQQVMIVNGVRTDRRGITASWTLRASKVGTYKVTPSVELDGKRVSSATATIQVVAVGSPQAQHGGGGGSGWNPFDPFGFFGGQQSFGVQPMQPAPELEVPVDPKLSLDKPRDAIAFLHATLDKPKAVVGEQVTLTVYLYVDATMREPDFSDAHEAVTSDFVRRSLMKDDAKVEDAGYAMAGGKVFTVRVLRRAALFPLKTGDLEVGPMSLAIPNKGVRESETLKVTVGEPPIAGRPAGYSSGDVGHFALDAKVDPTTVPRGGAIGVTVTLSGTGNLPSSLPLPIQAGIEWLEPEVHEKLGAKDGRYGGERTFSFVVKAAREGDVDLGEIALPFYDPDGKRFDVARASLGTLHVTKSDAATADPAATVLSDLPGLRKSMGGTRVAVAHATDRPWAFPLLLAPALALGLVLGGARARQAARERAAQRKTSPEALLADKARALDEALGGDDAGAVDAATIRMVEAAVVARLGKNTRAATGDALVRELTQAGAAEEVATTVRELLSECEAARFSPDAASTKDARKRAERARAIAGELGKKR